MVNNNLFNQLKRHQLKYLMLLPALSLVLLFSYFPLYGLYMAFSDYRLGFSILSSKFAGLSHFQEFLTDSADMLYLLRNTICMNMISLVVCLFGAYLLAIMLNEVKIPLLKRVVQTSSFFPFFISWAIVYNIFMTFFSVNNGVINKIMIDLGILQEGINYLAEPKYAWALIVGSNLWKSVGYNSVIFLASISGIDQEMYEAAEIDGADRLQKIMHITVPSLFPTLQVLLVLNVGWLFSSNFDQYYLFLNGMNRPMMEVFDLYIYRYGIKQMDYSYATAVGILKSVSGVVLILFVNKASKRLNGKGIL